MTTSQLRAAAYARVSSQQQVDANTIASQVEALRDRIRSDGLDVDPEFWFLDDGHSGATLLRPALERLRDQVAAGVVDRVYVHSPDRLARSYACQAGTKADLVAARLARQVVRPLVADHPRLVLALDDTPTPRYGPHVQGAGIHHNPTPGPTGGAFLYGHLWVVLAVLVPHPLWGVAALPLLARLYVRRTDLPGIERPHRPSFRTKLELAADLMRWAKMWLGMLGKPLWVVADGAYAKKPFLAAMSALGATVVSRLRKDAALCDVPPPKCPGQRGRPRVYGENAISLARRAGQRRGWTTGTFDLYGESVTKRYKTFRATWRPAGGVIRVVLVDEPHGWRAYFCTDPAARVADILGLVADRFSLEKSQAHYPSSRRWGAAGRIGYHRRDGVARTGFVVPAAPRRSHRRSRMSDTTRRPVPPRAEPRPLRHPTFRRRCGRTCRPTAGRN